MNIQPKIKVEKDGDGFLAEVENIDGLYAFGKTEKEAKKELLNVIEMTMDYHLEQVEIERKLKNDLVSQMPSHAV